MHVGGKYRQQGWATAKVASRDGNECRDATDEACETYRAEGVFCLSACSDGVRGRGGKLVRALDLGNTLNCNRHCVFRLHSSNHSMLHRMQSQACCIWVAVASVVLHSLTSWCRKEKYKHTKSGPKSRRGAGQAPDPSNHLGYLLGYRGPE
jgi:hypothetical protein